MNHLLTDTNGKIQPWKNGGGSTLELFRIPHPENPDDFIFRISMATVASSGPFSEFKNIDRILFLISGDGMKLSFPSKEIKLNTTLFPIFFSGEEKIQCELLGGSCLDFNIMTDRRYGTATLEINSMSLEQAQNIVSSDEIFLYQDPKQNLFLIRYQSLTTKK